MPRVLTCMDVTPAQDGTCAQTAWVEAPMLLPALTLEQGKAIGHALLLAMISVAVVKVFLSPRTITRN